MTKTITINALECYPNLNGLENIVKNISWTLIVNETINGNVETVSITGTTQVPEADSNTFTPFASLTAEQVVGWVNAYTDIDTLANHLVRRRTAELAVIPTETLAPPF